MAAQEQLIPGLPNEIAELCLLHVPYPYQALSRSVSSTWNRAITHPSFIVSKKTLSHPHLFVLAFHSQTAKVQWQALDPSSGRWFLLPQMPLPESVCPAAFACAALPRQGKLFVMGGARSGDYPPMRTNLVYRAATNQWEPAAAMPGGTAFFAAEGVDGRIVAVGRGGADVYDPESDTWREGKRLGGELERYEVVAARGKVYVTEGWWWPFMFRPRGWVYEVGRDTWREMGVGMREGWTGVSVAVGGRVFVIAEYGDSPVKVYDEECDTWRSVGGGRFPREVMKRPFAATGLDDRIYVASSGLNVAIGSVVNNSDRGRGVEVKVTWQVVEAPRAFLEFSPCSCQVLYA
ncbi:F-box protein AFR [Spatholobus suberectus]|nr:F-box protein AFR [Spatholobus suberectus]